MARARRHLRILPAIAALLLAAGCTVGPDHVRPPLIVDLPDGYVAERGDRHARPSNAEQPDRAGPAAATDHLAAWWTAFGDTTLERLVASTIDRNQDLRRAAARVLEARALLGGTVSDRWPRLEIGGSASRSRASLAAFGGRGIIDREFYEANLAARYEADLWGRLSRAEEAALAAMLQSELNRRVVLQTLIADVVRLWLQVNELQCQLDLTRSTAASYSHTLSMVEERYARGMVPAFEVHLARQNLLNARAAEPELQRQLAEVLRRLEILGARYPAGRDLGGHGGIRDDATVPRQIGALPGIERPMPSALPAVPAGLPSTLIERRPDVLAAEAGLHAATAGVGAAKARLFPALNLTGNAGSVSSELTRWFDRGTEVWSLIAGLTMPLINRGATRAQVRAAEARAEQALAVYYQTVLVALGEVESALDAEHFHSRREELLAASVREARLALDLAQQRYGAGLDNLLVTLEAQRRLLSVTGMLLSTQRAHRTARVNLILALGGPWDLEPTAADPRPVPDSSLEGDRP